MRVISVAHCKENMKRLADGVLPDAGGSRSIEASYRDAVSKLRGVEAGSESCRISFSDSEIAKLAFSHGVFLPSSDEASFSDDEKQALRDLTERSLAHIGEISPALLELVELITTDIVFVKSDRIGGGSGSHLPGVICVSVDQTWTEVDLAESITHEATHLTTFLSDMIFGHYTKPASQLEAEACRVLSAVRAGQRRPLDKALHSGLVAVPLMFMQSRDNSTELIEKFSTSLKQCSDGLLTKQQFFTPYGWSVVNDLARFSDGLDMSYVEDSLGWSDSKCQMLLP